MLTAFLYPEVPTIRVPYYNFLMCILKRVVIGVKDMLGLYTILLYSILPNRLSTYLMQDTPSLEQAPQLLGGRVYGLRSQLQTLTHEL